MQQLSRYRNMLVTFTSYKLYAFVWHFNLAATCLTVRRLNNALSMKKFQTFFFSFLFLSALHLSLSLALSLLQCFLFILLRFKIRFKTLHLCRSHTNTITYRSQNVQRVHSVCKQRILCRTLKMYRKYWPKIENFVGLYPLATRTNWNVVVWIA